MAVKAQRWAIAAGILCVAARARAGDAATPAMTSARTALEEQRYADAIAMVRGDFESADLEKRADAFEIASIALLLDARPSEAALYVHALYEIAPGFQLSDPSLPPRVTAPFDAEAARPHDRAVALAIDAGEPGAGYALKLSRRAARLTLSCRPSAGGQFSPVALTNANASANEYRFALPTRGTYSCFAIAAESPRIVVGRLGSPEHPVTVRPEAPAPSSSVLGTWWFWTAVGAAIVGGTAIVYAETRPRDVTAPPADLTVHPQAFRFP